MCPSIGQLIQLHMYEEKSRLRSDILRSQNNKSENKR